MATGIFQYNGLGDGGGSPCEDDENLMAVSKAFLCGRFKFCLWKILVCHYKYNNYNCCECR